MSLKPTQEKKTVGVNKTVQLGAGCLVWLAVVAVLAILSGYIDNWFPESESPLGTYVALLVGFIRAIFRAIFG